MANEDNQDEMDDVFSGASDSEMDAFNEMLASLSSMTGEDEAPSEEPPPSEEDALSPFGMDAEQLPADETSGAWVTSDDLPENIGIEAFSEEADAFEEKMKKSKRKFPFKLPFRRGDRPNKGLLLIVSVLSVLTFAGMVTLVVLLVILNNVEPPPQYNAVSVTQDQNTLNNANFIHIGETKVLDDIHVTVDRLLVDQSATVFYMNDLKQNYFMYRLTDDLGNVYVLDNERGMTQDDTVLYFSPLDTAAQVAYLRVTNLDTMEHLEFGYHFADGLQQRNPIYVRTVEASLPTGGTLYVDSITISSAGTTLLYSYDIEENVKANIAPPTLSENARALLPARETPVFSEIDGKRLLRMDYSALRRAESLMYVSFDDVSVTQTVNLDIAPEDIFFVPEQPIEQISTPSQDTTFVLEGFALQGDQYILVAHAETSGSEHFDAGRIRILLNATLTATLDDGSTITLQGESNSIQAGCDTVFSIAEHPELAALPPSALALTIHDITYFYNPIVVEAEATYGAEVLGYSSATAIADLEAAFESRLAYKSGEITKDAIVGFDEAVLMQTREDLYAPTDRGGVPAYDVYVTSHSVQENVLHAIVQELWVTVDGTTEIIFENTHEVRAELSSTGWLITYDEIV